MLTLDKKNISQSYIDSKLEELRLFKMGELKTPPFLGYHESAIRKIFAGEKYELKDKEKEDKDNEALKKQSEMDSRLSAQSIPHKDWSLYREEEYNRRGLTLKFLIISLIDNDPDVMADIKVRQQAVKDLFPKLI